MAESLKVGQLYAEITTKGLPTVARGLENLRKRLFNLKTAFVGFTTALGMTKLAKEILNAGASMETYQKRLLLATRDAKVAREEFQRLSKWAAINPVDTDDAVAAFVRLKSAAVKNTFEATQAVGNLASMTGDAMADVAGAVVSALPIALKRYGIYLDQTGAKATITSGNVKLAVNKDIDSIRAGLVSVIQQKFPDAMDQMNGTWTGVMRTMGGLWGEFKRNVAGDAGTGGPFDMVKSAVIGIKDRWAAWIDDPAYRRFISEVQNNIDDILVGIVDIGIGSLKMLGKVADVVNKYKGPAGYGLLGWVLFGPKGAAVGAMFGLLKQSLGESLTRELVRADVVKENEKQLAGLKKAWDDAEQAAKDYADAHDRGIFTPYTAQEEAEIDRLGQIADSYREAYRYKSDKLAAGVEGEVEARINGIKKEANAAGDAFVDLSAKGVQALEKIREDMLKARGKKYDPNAITGITGSGGSRGNGASAEQRLNAVKAVIQRMRDEITYAGASAADFLPVLDQMLGRYPRLSEEWKAVKDLQLEGLEEIKTKAQESVQRIVEAEDWRYSVGITSAEQYFATLKARYIDAMMSLEGVAEGSLRDKLTGQMREAYEGLQNVAVAALDQVREKMDAGAMSTEQAHAFALKLIDALNVLGIEPPEALKKFADGTDEAKERMKDLEAQSKKWIEDFQSGIADAIVDGKNFGDVLTDIGKQIEKMILKMLLFGTNGDSGVFGGLFKGIGNLFSVKAPGRHTGGVVGVDPPSFFRSLLPKYHSGGIVGAGEELAILRKREAVFTPEQMKALGAAVNRPRMGDIKIEVNAYNDGYGNMSDEQAQGIGEMVKGIVKAQVAEEFYTYSRSGYFRTAGAM